MQDAWRELFKRYQREHPELAAEFARRMAGELPANWSEGLRAFAEDAQAALQPLETRKSSQSCLDALAPALAGAVWWLSRSHRLQQHPLE